MSEPRFTAVAALLHERPLMSDDPYEGFLKAKEAALLAELASVRATLADRARLTGKTSEQPTGSDDKTKPKRQAREKSNPYSGLTISDAIVEVLEESSVPLSTGQIWSVLQKAGVEPISEDSVKAITWTLRKRARHHKDVVRVAYGKWDLRARYSDAQLRKITKSNTGMGAHSREDHVARTKAGIEKRRAAGLRVGQPSKMTPEVTSQLESMMRAGDSISSISRRLEISVATIRNHYSRDDIVKLRAEGVAEREREPSEPDPAGNEPSRLRVVK
jgi:hypothetical protein